MSSVDFRCNACGHEWTFYKKERHHQFPVHPNCEKCNSDNTQRLWGKSNIHINVKSGKAGNAANGYSSKGPADASN